MQKTNDVIGLGNMMMDFLVEVDDDRLLEFDLKKGEMHLVDHEKAKLILSNINHTETAPGGSAANTLRGVAFLGGKAILCGKVGNDPLGENLVQEIENHGVTTRISKHHHTTGHSVSFITPDTERTMSTHLGAAIELSKEDILEEDIQNSKVLHLEGYQLEGPTKEVVLYAIELAKKHGTLVSIDLADPGLIRRNKELLQSLIRKVDIVFANEKEAKEFTGVEEVEAARELGKLVKIAIVKIGERGSLICSEGELVKVEGFPAKAVDTTGAGDTFAAGFLYGYCQGWSLAKAGKLGSLLAARIVEKIGVKVKELDVEGIKGEVE